MLNRSTQTQPQVGAAGTTAATGGGSAIPVTGQPQSLTAPAAGNTQPAVTPGNGGAIATKTVPTSPPVADGAGRNRRRKTLQRWLKTVQMPGPAAG